MKVFYKKYLGILTFLFCGITSATYSYAASSQTNSSRTESAFSSEARVISNSSSAGSSLSDLDTYIKQRSNSSDSKLKVVLVSGAQSSSKIYDKSIGFERDGDRTYKSDDLDYPFDLKCGPHDYRTLHFCPKITFFSPAARVYFDSGDADDKLDMFNDGNLNANIDFVSIYVPLRFGRSQFYDSISWGPALGVGISAPAKSDDAEKATGAPVVLASLGFQFEYALGSNGSSCSFELGRAIGFSSDESLNKVSDQATYVGLKIKIATETGKK
ncbi:MAG: hypothetical protein EOO52_14340 [Gammaproteobacteria bacterium]|nr:MAG: hypothetical protein EOO52_14340 [Gammaproteobacteria bacterium]